MEEKLRALLTEDEKLLWSGRPEPFDTLDETNKKSIVIGTLIKSLITLAILVAYIVASLREGEIKLPILIAFLALAAFAIDYPFLTAGHLRKKYFYGLTDRRILRIGENTESVPYARIKSAALRTDSDGHTTLLCGTKTAKRKPQRWRNAADTPFGNRPEEPEAEDVVLYALPMDDELKTILNKYLPLH